MSPTPIPPINIPYDKITEAVAGGIIDAVNDPIAPVIVALTLLTSIVGILAVKIRRALH